MEYPIFYTVVMSIVGRLASIVWDLMAAVILDAVKGKSIYAVNVSCYFFADDVLH